MKLLWRIFWNIAGSAALLVFTAAAAMWVCTYHETYYFTYSNDWNDPLHDFNRQLSISLGKGAMWIYANSEKRIITVWAVEERRNGVFPQAEGKRYVFDTEVNQPVPYPEHVALGIGYDWWYVTGPDVPFEGALFGSLGPARRLSFSLRLPLWFILLASSAPAALWLRYLRRSLTRRRLGLCANCGYDLRATPQRCPECGFIPERYNLSNGPGPSRN